MVVVALGGIVHDALVLTHEGAVLRRLKRRVLALGLGVVSRRDKHR